MRLKCVIFGRRFHVLSIPNTWHNYVNTEDINGSLSVRSTEQENTLMSLSAMGRNIISRVKSIDLLDPNTENNSRRWVYAGIFFMQKFTTPARQIK